MNCTSSRTFRYAAKRLTLRANEVHMFAAGFALAIYRANAIYSFIPKNACSTLRYSLARANGVLTNDRQIAWIHRNNATFRASLPDLVRADYAFTVLRSPFGRLASCFLDKFVKGEGTGQVFAKRHGAELGTISFERFVRALADADELKADQHWRPQVDFLVFEQYDDWFAFERFEEAVRKLDERIGFPVYDARGLTLHGVERLEQVGAPGEYCGATVDDVRQMKRFGRIPSTESLFSTELRELLARLYATDLKLYKRRIGLPAIGQ